MMPGDVVQSLRGHDSGQMFYVVGVEPPFLFLADGKRRKSLSPKRKREKHVQLVQERCGITGEKLHGGDTVTDSELRRALAEVNKGGTAVVEG